MTREGAKSLWLLRRGGDNRSGAFGRWRNKMMVEIAGTTLVQVIASPPSVCKPSADPALARTKHLPWSARPGKPP